MGSQNILTSRALTANWRLATRRRPPLLLAPPRRRRLHASPDPPTPCGVTRAVSFSSGLPLSPSLSSVSSLPHPRPHGREPHTTTTLHPYPTPSHSPSTQSPSPLPPTTSPYLPPVPPAVPLCPLAHVLGRPAPLSRRPGGPLRARQPPPFRPPGFPPELPLPPPFPLPSPWPSLFPSLVPLSLSRSLSLSLFRSRSSRPGALVGSPSTLDPPHRGSMRWWRRRR
jgi:hypothetical protein